MSRKTISALALSLAAVLALTVAATSASAFPAFFNEYKVRGNLTPKKLNQTITLPTGSFNGEAQLNFVPQPGGGFGVEGPLVGTTTIPEFTAEVKLFGIPAKLKTKFTAEPANGSITSVEQKNCEPTIFKEGCEHLSVPTHAEIEFTALTILGLTIPEKCETISKVLLGLETNINLAKLLNSEPPFGSFFKGTANFPIVICRGLFGLINGPLLTALFSGPNNPYEISVTPE